MAASTPAEYGLRLSAVRVEDYRTLKDLTVTFSPGTTVLVGENNSGKTSLLEALGVAFGQRRPQVEDLHEGPSGKATSFQLDLRIEAVEGKDFPDSVRDIVGNGIQLDSPEYFNLRVSGTVGAEGWDITLSRTFVKGWATNRADAAKLEKLDSPSVSRQVLQLLNYDMLDARRDIVEQLRNRRTYWGRTTSMVSITDEVKEDLEKSLLKLGDDLTTKSEVLSQLRDDLSELSNALSQGRLEVELEALPRKVEDLIRAMDIVVTSPASSPFPVGSQGMGTRSLAALLVFRSYVNVVRPRQNAARMLSVAAFEEPEAHLHPQAQRSAFKVLSQIGGQRIVSTHSAFVASIAALDSYRLFRRVGPVSRVSEISDSLRSGWDEELVRRYVQIQNPEVLFSKAVGIVEGQMEAAAFPVFAEARWGKYGADAVGVTLLYTEGAGGSKHIVPFLDALGIPWVIFCDADGAGRKGLNATASVIRRVLDETSPEVVQLPSGASFEDYIMSLGLQAQVKEAADKHTDGPLEDYMKRLHGHELSKDRGTRDYESTGGKTRACLDFLKGNKGTVGRPLAEAIVSASAAGTVSIPPLIEKFFEKLDERLNA